MQTLTNALVDFSATFRANGLDDAAVLTDNLRSAMVEDRKDVGLMLNVLMQIDEAVDTGVTFAPDSLAALDQLSTF